MTKILIILTVLLLALNLLNIFTQSMSDSSNKKNFLWEVKSDSSTVYLLGSIHIGKKEMYPLNLIIENAFDECNNLVVEVDIKDIGITTRTLEMMYSGDSTIKDELSEYRYEKWQEIAKYCNTPSIMINKFRLGYSLIFLELKKLLEMGFMPDLGIDMYFLNKAEGKNILELETSDSQIELMNSLYYSLDTNTIDIELFKQSIEMMDSLMYAWQNGDTKYLEEIISSQDSIFSFGGNDIDYKLNDERNFKMVEKIEDYLKSNDKYFIIVGAAHLVGENGIINLLIRKNKYFIKQF